MLYLLIFYYHCTLLNYINLGILISICIEPEPGIIHDNNDYSIENAYHLYHMSDTAYLKAMRTHTFFNVYQPFYIG